MHDLLPYISAQLNTVINGLAFFMPELYLSVLFLLVLINDIVLGRESAKLCRYLAIGGLLVVIFKDFQQLPMAQRDQMQSLFGGMLALNHLSLVLKFIIDVTAIGLIVYMPWDNKLAAHPKRLSDLYSITIGSILGLHLMVMAVNLLSVYLAIEMVSIASYLMVAYRSENAFSSEAGVKYVLFGAAASAVMLYGISLLYGFTGNLNLISDGFVEGIKHGNQLAVSLAILLVLAGIGFKLSFVPIHFWVPDVYQGAPTPVTAYLSTLPKIAAFGLLINFLTPFIFMAGFQGLDFVILLSVVGIITMIAGNFAAIMQDNMKRMLAYSSIGHTGFALMAIVAFSSQGVSAMAYYLFVYALANVAALALASYFANAENAENASQLNGLGLKYPLASVCFVIVLISLTGLPVSAGFTGKLFVFSAAYTAWQHAHNIWLMLMMITGALTTVVSLFYYLKIPLNLFLKKSDNVTPGKYRSTGLMTMVVVMVILILLLGIFPDKLLQYF